MRTFIYYMNSTAFYFIVSVTNFNTSYRYFSTLSFRIIPPFIKVIFSIPTPDDKDNIFGLELGTSIISNLSAAYIILFI